MTATRVSLRDQLVLFGPDATSGVARELCDRGWQSIAVLMSSSARLPDALAGLDPVATFSGIKPHSPIIDTEEIAAQLADAELDALLVIGGGKVIDAAKAVALLLAEGGRLEDHCTTFTPPDHYLAPTLVAPKLPLVAVATTLAGAEMTPGGGGRNSAGIKRTFWDPALVARVAAFDPHVIASTPRDVVLSTGMNALAHCVEGLYSRTANPFSTALADAAAPLLASGLRAVSDGRADEEDYVRLGEAAAMAGMVIANARVGIGHAICHVVGARFGVPHGIANSIVLPGALRFNLPATGAQQQRFSELIGGPVELLRDELGLPARLRDVGVPEEALSDIAEHLMQERGLYFNPRRVRDAAEVETILRDVW